MLKYVFLLHTLTSALGCVLLISWIYFSDFKCNKTFLCGSPLLLSLFRVLCFLFISCLPDCRTQEAAGSEKTKNKRERGWVGGVELLQQVTFGT